MKKIVIEKIILQNFKKVRNHSEIEFRGKNANLFGKNGTGKTTIFDAFTWILFGKDSLGRSDQNKDFEIKPKDPITGQVINNLEVLGELHLLVNDRPIVLKRVLSEVWTKKRGSEEKEFDRNTTEHFVNGVLKLKREYESFINDEILDEEKFKILTNVKTFSEMNWAKRREILERLVTKSELDIINETPSLERLKDEMILGRTVEDVIKIHTQAQKNINKQLEDKIPSELKALHEMEYKNLEENYDDAANTKKLEASFEKLSKLEAELATGSNQSTIQEYESAKFKIETDISKLKRELETIEYDVKQEHQRKIRAEKNKLEDLERNQDKLYQDLIKADKDIAEANQAISKLEDSKKELYEKIDAINNEEFTADNCNFCGQALPEDKLEEAKEHFNLHKSERKEWVIAEGKDINRKIDNYTSLIENMNKKITDAEVYKTTLKDQIAEAKDLVSKLENDVPTGKTEKTIELEKKIETYQARLDIVVKQLRKEKESASGGIVGSAREEVKKEIEYLNTKKAEYSLKLQNEEKIKKLQEEMKKLNREYEISQAIILLGEKFRKIRSESIDEEVNQHFKIAKFKLTRTLQNGVIENICDAEFNGTTYESTSNGEKINIGLDVINTLQRLYGVSAPIFIDNAEAVSHWLVESNSQLIKMFVDPDVEVLEIQIEEV